MMFTEHFPNETQDEYKARMELEVIQIEIAQAETTKEELGVPSSEEGRRKLEEVVARLEQLKEEEREVTKRLPRGSDLIAA